MAVGERTSQMWFFLFKRVRTKLMLLIALPLARALVHHLALFAERRGARSARLLHHADTAVSRASRRNRRRMNRLSGSGPVTPR